MEYSPLCPAAHATSLPLVRNKLLVLCVMLSLWAYTLYCCIGYCSSAPGLPGLAADPRETPSLPGPASDPRETPSLPSLRALSTEFPNGDSGGGEPDGGSSNRVEEWDEGRTLNDSETKKLPQAIIIGVKKGGTRALLEFLRLHPDIRAVGAEPHFFDRNYEKGLEWYRDLMPKSLEGQITMEKTPSYLVTKEVPGRIFAMSKDTKLIVVVRDPVTRAISDYTQTRSKKPDIPSFESLTFKNSTAGLIDATWSALQIGMYARHLERWLRFFPINQILFVSGERLITDPAGEMARVQDFLGLRRVVTNKYFHFNPAKGFPCLTKPESNSKPHCLGKTKGRTHPNIHPDVVQRLRDFYKPFNRKFYHMTGQDFGWD